MGRLNRDAYIKVMTGYEPPGLDDGKCHFALLIVLEIDDDDERRRKMELGTIDKSIRVALPHSTLVGPDVWELFN